MLFFSAHWEKKNKTPETRKQWFVYSRSFAGISKSDLIFPKPAVGMLATFVSSCIRVDPQQCRLSIISDTG